MGWFIMDQHRGYNFCTSLNSSVSIRIRQVSFSDKQPPNLSACENTGLFLIQATVCCSMAQLLLQVTLIIQSRLTEKLLSGNLLWTCMYCLLKLQPRGGTQLFSHLLAKASQTAMPGFKRVVSRILLHGGALNICQQLYPLEVKCDQWYLQLIYFII